MGRQAIARGFQATADGGGPGGEVGGDAVVDRQIFSLDLERQPADGTAVLAAGGEELVAIAFEDGEDALDGIVLAGEGGPQDGGFEPVEIVVEDGEEEGFLAGEDVVEAAAIDLGALE